MSMDISDFYQTFFDEADELLADMEQHLLGLDPQEPDSEQLNAIFRAAHSIKGGAGTFGFTVLQETTHILENILDGARRGEMQLSTDIINLFLETKDIMQEQLDAYKTAQEPNAESFNYICEALRQLALEAKGLPVAAPAVAAAAPAVQSAPASSGLRVKLVDLKEKEVDLMLEELGNLGSLSNVVKGSDFLEASIDGVSKDDIVAVLCFVIEEAQIRFPDADAAPVAEVVPVAAPAPVAEAAPVQSASVSELPVAKREGKRAAAPAKTSESSSIRVAVEKVDQLIRMMPMEYVFSRFPRLVRDLASKLGKEVELTLLGSSTELDKSLIERIIDPLTHLVRNSLDHGIEAPEKRLAAGKVATGNLTLSAEHQGGNICIEVSDDGAGLNRERILAKALSSGLPVSENMSDEEVGMLIFAPGFSTAEQVTDVSGRGVGMDVVKRNIQEMGGHVEIASKQGKGTTIRILLPLTLAILDGMSVRVADEVFILPLNAVMESLQPRGEELKPLAGGECVLEVRGEYLPLVELWNVFDVQGAKTEATQGIVVILQSAGKRYALLVDQLIGQHQVVVKNLESNYRKVPGISAATILGDGSVALIVDVSALQSLNREKRVAGAAA